MTFDKPSSGVDIIKSIAEEKDILLDVQMSASNLITGDDNMLATVVRNPLFYGKQITSLANGVVIISKEVVNLQIGSNLDKYEWINKL